MVDCDFMGPRNPIFIGKAECEYCCINVRLLWNITKKFMKQILDKLKLVLTDLEKELGPVSVFALFLRTDPLEKWDIVVAASWLYPNELSSYELINSKIQNVLTPSDLLKLARIVILSNLDPVVSFLQDSVSVTNGSFGEVAGDIFTEKFGFTIKQAYLLRCQRI